MVNIAKTDLSHFKFENTPVEIIHTDANSFNPIERTIIFLSNPFVEKTLPKVMDNVGISLSNNPREIKIVYFNSTGRSVLDKLIGWNMKQQLIAIIQAPRCDGISYHTIYSRHLLDPCETL